MERVGGLTALVRRVRRAIFVRRLRLAAARVGSTVVTDVALDVQLGRRIVVEMAPHSRAELTIGPGCRIRDDVTLQLNGGSVRIGPWTDVRRHVVLSVSGSLELEGNNVLSWGSMVHCGGRIVLRRYAFTSDHVSLVDSAHYLTQPDVAMHRNVKPGTIEIGRNTLIGSKATVLRGSRVGAYCVVGANSVISGSVPDGSVAIGVPATYERRELPWGELSQDERAVAQGTPQHREDLGSIDSERRR